VHNAKIIVDNMLIEAIILGLIFEKIGRGAIEK